MATFLAMVSQLPPPADRQRYAANWRIVVVRTVIAALLVFVLGCNRPTDESQASDSSSTSVSKQNMPTYPSTEKWLHANTKQKERAQRSFGELKIRHVPVYSRPLFVDDAEEATPQTAQDVARRTLVLWAVELRAEGVPKTEARQIIDELGLWDYVSPNEKQFLDDDNPSPETCQKLVWRLESLWVLMWSLGYIDDLDWPNGMCDVDKLAGLLTEYEDNPAFISNAKLRPIKELLDAQDLIMRIHWAIRDARLNHGGMIPEGLDWSANPEFIPVTMSPAVGVVEQRHYVLNWIVNFLDPENWDAVDTPT